MPFNHPNLEGRSSHVTLRKQTAFWRLASLCTTLKTLSYDGQETIWLVRAQEVAWFRFLIETELPPWPLPESRSVLASSVDVVLVQEQGGRM